MLRGSALVGAIVLLVSMPACGSATSPPAGSDPPSASTGPATGSTTIESPSMSPEPPPSSPEPSPPSPPPEPLGPSRARLTVTGDIETRLSLPLAGFDSFTATWCDARNCANAANTLQLMGEGLGELGRHETPRGIFVTIEVHDRFLYVSGAQHVQGECRVTFTVADERGLAGEIVCPNITNGTGLGVLALTVRGTFAAAA